MSHPQIITRAYDATIDKVIPGERAVVAVITTDAIDRYGEVVVPKGIDLDNFRKNPVVFFNHASYTMPIGTCQWIKPTSDKRGLVAKTIFRTGDGDGDEDDEADEIFKCYQEGILKAFSIGFRPDFEKMGRPTPEEIKARPELAECRCMYRKSELLEYSAVGIPANPEALSLAVSKGFKIARHMSRLIAPPAQDAPADELPPLPEHRTLAQVEAAALEAARKQFDPRQVQEQMAWEALYYLSGKP